MKSESPTKTLSQQRSPDHDVNRETLDNANTIQLADSRQDRTPRTDNTNILQLLDATVDRTMQIDNDKVTTPRTSNENSSGSYSPPTPPNTPKKPAHPPHAEQDLIKASIENRFNNAQSLFGKGLIPPLTPLTVTTDYPAYGMQTKSSVSPYVQSDPNCLKSPLIVNVPFSDSMNEEEIKKQKDYIAKVVQDALLNQYPEPVKKEDGILKPFPLQDPPKPKFKRQISTDSNDPSDIKYFEKSPTKKLTSHHERGQHIDVQCRAQLSTSEGTPSEAGIDMQEKPYANNLQWVINTNDPSPSKEEDFIDVRSPVVKCAPPISYHHGNNTTQKSQASCMTDRYTEPINRQSGTASDKSQNIDRYRVNPYDEDFRRQQISEKNLHRKSLYHHQSEEQRGERLQSDSYSPEKGFIFPTRATVTQPITPAVMAHEARHKFKTATTDTSAYTKSGNMCTVPSTSSRHVTYKESPDHKERYLHPHMSQEEFHREMISLSQYQSREARFNSTTTASLSTRSDNHVTEKGFVFPSRPTVTQPVPMSPRGMSYDIRPRFKVNVPDMPDNVKKLSTNVCENPSTVSIQQMMSPSYRDRKQDVNQFGKEALTNLWASLEKQRRNTLRSNSDIGHSPSKSEIEEVKRLEQSIRRSFSDPSSTPPRQKEMLAEERMREIPGSDDVFLDIQDHEQVFNLERKKYEHGPFDKYPLFSGIQQLENYLKNAHSYYPNRQLDLTPSEVKRQLQFNDGPSHSSTGGRGRGQSECRSRSTHEPLPDHLVQLFLTSNICTQSDIDSFNERDMSIDTESTLSSRDLLALARGLHRSPSYPAPAVSAGYGISDDDSNQYRGTPSNRIPYHSTPQPRPRNRGDVDIRVTCSDISEKSKSLLQTLKTLEHNEKNCSCSNVENEILHMARDAYKKIRRHDDSKKSFEQFENELQETNNKIFDAMQILCSIKSICKHGRTIQDITTGSVIFRVRCPTSLALRDLWQFHKSGKLEKLFNDSFVTDALRAKYPDIKIYLKVEVQRTQFRQVLNELDYLMSPGMLDTSLSKSDTEIANITGECSKENVMIPEILEPTAVSVIHIRSHSAPITHIPSPVSSPSWLTKSPLSPHGMERRFFPPAGDKSPRRAMKEINGQDVPCSPTMKKLFDFDHLTLSPSTSPKRKTFEGLPWEHDNHHTDLQSPKRKNFGNAFPLKDKSNDG